MDIEIGGLLGLLILIADIWALVHVLGSSASVGAKVIWTLVILIFSLVGFLIWLVFGPRTSRV